MPLPLVRPSFWVPLLSLLLAWPGAAPAQLLEFAHRPVAEVRLQGLSQVPEQLVRNQLRMLPGQPFDPDIVQQDIVRLEHLGRFAAVTAQVQPLDDGSLILTYRLVEQPLLRAVGVVGNRDISDQKLLEAVVLRAGDPADPFLLQRGVQRIDEAYQKKGYYLTEVQYDQALVDQHGLLIYQVREGPKIRIRAIRIEGSGAFSDKELLAQIKSQAYNPLIFWRHAELDRDQLDLDAAALRNYYRDRGYIDAQVAREVELSPDQKSAVVTFHVQEGPRYSVRDMRVGGNTVFTAEQILQALPLKKGGIYSAKQAQASQDAIADLYGKLGFIDTRIETHLLRLYEQAQVAVVDVLFEIDEGRPSLVGTVAVRGNQVTKDKVILRQTRGLTPGRPFDRTRAAQTERRLRESNLFGDAKLTVLGQPSDEVRDVLIEVEEINTGSLGFGAGVSSDLGVMGSISLKQRNFDIGDWPDSPRDFFTGKGFRGAGQGFGIDLAPGFESSNYSVSFTEPYFLESDYSFNSRGFYFQREREDWEEGRFGGSTGVGRRFGDVWSANTSFRGEAVDIGDIDEQAPVDVFEVEGDSLITTLGFSITRNTTDSLFYPSRGSRLTMGIDRALPLGDFDFSTASLEYRKFWTVDQDFMNRKTILSFRGESGYIFAGDAPVFERLYAGGHRSLRGFEYRGAGPRGYRHDDPTKLGDDPVGGDWLFLAGLEYDVPVYKEVLRWVFFVDTGTVQEDVGFDEYRVSVGTGVRVRVPFLTQAGPPIALDVAVPLRKEDGDQTQLISFDMAIPF